MVLTIPLLFMSISFSWQSSKVYAKNEEKDLSEVALHGKSIQIDPLFGYYKDRSVKSIVDEIELAGYESVHYFVVNENQVDGELIDEFRNRGIAVWALVLGNGTYSTAAYPAEWPEWEMELVTPQNDGYTRLSPHSENYRQWKKDVLADLVLKYPFDGIEIAEPYFPEWNGFDTGNYGDIGPNAQKAFFEEYNESEIPDFTDETKSNYYLNDQELYDKWIQFRVDGVNSFLDELINGENGVKDVRPDILVATWSLAIDAGDDSFETLRERQGLDAAEMVGAVQPDIHFFQTHYPDWMRPDLPTDYIKHYRPFVEQLKNVHPNMPLGVQADIGSIQNMIKNQEWVDAFSDTAFAEGFQTWTAYEYFIGGHMYESIPTPMKAVRIDDHEVNISFNKRIDPNSVTDDAVTFVVNGETVLLEDVHYEVDGSILKITNMNLPVETFDVVFNGILDTPDLWLFGGYEANEVVENSSITVEGE